MNTGTWRPTLSGYLFETFKSEWGNDAIKIFTDLSERTTITIEAKPPIQQGKIKPIRYTFLRGFPPDSVTHLSVNFIDTIYIDGRWHILGYFHGSDESNWIGQWNLKTKCFCLCPVASILCSGTPLNPYQEVLVYEEVGNPKSKPVSRRCGPIFLHPKLKCPVRYIHTDTSKRPSKLNNSQLVWWTECPIARGGVWLRKRR